jgi:hypothetical protein
VTRHPPRPPGQPYDIGYGKPPVATRFPKGTSGNPGGRPRRSETADTLLAKILARKVTVRDGNGVQKLTVLETMLRSLANSAARGDLRATKLILERVESLQSDATPSPHRADSGPSAREVLEERLRALAERLQNERQ